jgi:hypothetical protein
MPLSEVSESMCFRGLSLRALLAVAGIALAFPIRGFAAAQLAAGAKTSAQPTSTNPQQRQLQITFDPAVVPADSTPSTPDYNVTSFKLSVSYDAMKLKFKGVEFIDPYEGTLVDLHVPGEITLAGEAPFDETQPGDVNLFSINFELRSTAPTAFDDTLHITIFADPTQGDFITGTPAFGPPVTTDPGHIEETALVGSFNQFAAEIAGEAAVPIPSVLPAAVCLFGIVAARRWVARPRRLV